MHTRPQRRVNLHEGLMALPESWFPETRCASYRLQGTVHGPIGIFCTPSYQERSLVVGSNRWGSAGSVSNGPKMPRPLGASACGSEEAPSRIHTRSSNRTSENLPRRSLRVCRELYRVASYSMVVAEGASSTRAELEGVVPLRLFFDDQDFDGQLLRALSYAASGCRHRRMLSSWAGAKSGFCSHEGKLKIHNPTTPPPVITPGCAPTESYSRMH